LAGDSTFLLTEEALGNADWGAARELFSEAVLHAMVEQQWNGPAAIPRLAPATESEFRRKRRLEVDVKFTASPDA
jgi:hypothetical protein